MTKAFIGLGSNLGCKVGNIRRAIRILSQHPQIRGVELSSFYRTEPVGNVEQDWFVNAVAAFDTSLSARGLLDLCLETELKLKRVRAERWGPRTLDIDILFFGEERHELERLEVPHPRVCERAFVLQALLELYPEFEWDGKSLAPFLADVSGQGIECMEPVVAVLGASEREDRYANMAQSLLMDSGYKVVPVSPRGGSILGVPVQSSLTQCSVPVDTVAVYVGSMRVGALVDDLIAVHPRRVIFNPGTENARLKEQLEAAGIETLEACTLVLLRTKQF